MKSYKGEGTKLIGAMLEAPAFYENLSGRKNLQIIAELYGKEAVNRIDEVLKLKVSGAIGLGIGIFMLIGLIGVVAPESLKGLITGVSFNSVAALDLASLKQNFFSSSIYVLFFSILNVLIFRNKEIIY